MRHVEHDHIDGFCSQCREACESVTIDEGIGTYEYWGSVGTHHDYVEASPCCHAEVVEELPLECPSCKSHNVEEIYDAAKNESYAVCQECNYTFTVE